MARAPERVAASKAPDFLFESHTAPIDLLFYEGRQFPPAYRQGAFVTLRGSWNASVPRGYAVAFVPFENGMPKGSYEVFATGWRVDEQRQGRAQVWGRPAGLAQLADGSLLVSDDTSGTIWRIAAQ